MDLFLVLIIRPTLLQVVFNQKIKKWESLFVSEYFEEYCNAQFIWHYKKK